MHATGLVGAMHTISRSEPPVQWISINGPLKPQAYDLKQAKQSTAEDYLQNRKSYLENKDVRILFAELSQPMKYYFRNADADEVLFVHYGEGCLETDFGPLNYGPEII